MMAGSGPAPNPASRRQTGNQAHTWLDLPRGGFDGAVPEWPLVTNQVATDHKLNRSRNADDAEMIPLDRDAQRLDEREAEVWRAIWRSPQAAAWELNGWVHDVGLYVRALVLGEFGDLDNAKEARMWSDRLGLNPAAMLKNRWRVRGDEVATRRTERKPARKRLKVVDSDAVAGS
jgi:hypothetical protein